MKVPSTPIEHDPAWKQDQSLFVGTMDSEVLKISLQKNAKNFLSQPMKSGIMLNFVFAEKARHLRDHADNETREVGLRGETNFWIL